MGNKIINKKEIPEEWKRRSLAKVCKVQGGFAFKSEEFLKDGIPLIKISNINGGSVKLEKNNSYISNNRLKFYKSFIIKEGDILIALSGATVGKIGRIKSIKLSLLNQRVGRFIEYSDFISKKYLFYALLKGEMLKYIINNAASSAQPNISPSFIENFKILFPSSLTEQCKIAEILEIVDETIEKTDAIIKKYKRIKQGLMQDLLTKGIDENGQIRSEETHKFKDSPLGRIPEEWEAVSLYEIVNVINGGTPSTSRPEYWNGNIPWLSVEDFNKSKRWVFLSAKYITELGLKRSATRLLKKGMLIISARGTVGIVTQLGRNMAFNQSSYGLDSKNKKRLSNDFLYYVLKFYINLFLSLAYGNVFDTITRENFKEIKILLPLLPEQSHIAGILSQIDETIEKEQKYKAKLERIKQGLMENLLTGKVRVNHLIKEGVASV